MYYNINLYYRLDCLRKVSIGAADFAVLQAEELIIASYSQNFGDILIAYQIRQHTKGNYVGMKSKYKHTNDVKAIFYDSVGLVACKQI